jgi:hypothetical protein
MKEARLQEHGIDKLFTFQPTLAGVLYRLEERRRQLNQRRAYLVSRKATYKSPWFTAQMQKVAHYSDVVVSKNSI